MYENIISNVCKHISLTTEEQELFVSMLDCRLVPKKTILLREGEVCKFEAYIQTGCTRIYYIDENGFEVTLQFAVEDWWVSDIASFHEQKPSNLIIETLEDCEMYWLTVETKEKLLSQIPKLERFFRLLVQRNLYTIQHRLINTYSKTATDRYLDFLKLYPDIPQRVAQHYIASYLGISAEFVSKIRKRLTSNK